MNHQTQPQFKMRGRSEKKGEREREKEKRIREKRLYDNTIKLKWRKRLRNWEDGGRNIL